MEVVKLKKRNQRTADEHFEHVAQSHRIGLSINQKNIPLQPDARRVLLSVLSEIGKWSGNMYEIAHFTQSDPEIPITRNTCFIIQNLSVLFPDIINAKIFRIKAAFKLM